jgi:hypothetical protein
MKNITLKDVLNGEIVTKEWFKRQYVLLLLIGGLLFLYVYQGYVLQRQHHRMSELKKEIQDADYQLMTMEATLTDLTRQSSVEAELAKRGSRLQTNKTPAIRIQP